MTTYEARRLENIERNKALIQDLGIPHHALQNRTKNSHRHPEAKRRKLSINATPTRSSARTASIPAKPISSPPPDSDLQDKDAASFKRPRGTARKVPKQSIPNHPPPPQPKRSLPSSEVERIRRGWSSWTPSAPSPSREDPSGTFHFESHPDFTPNKSPEEMLRQGCFGGSYFRPLHSQRLGITVQDDWRELPSSWTQGLSVDKYLTNSVYDAGVNKFKVSCGQSIEQWEANGWIDHTHDVRGWFQWYCRFFKGRRCEDDDRQVSRWRKCVGETGRWRRALLRKYVAMGIREVWDDGESENGQEVSPVIHQTCLHWAFEVKQDTLDEFWRDET